MHSKTKDLLGEISKFTYTAKYSRYRDDLKRRESWAESVDRLLMMHLKKYKHLPKEDKDKIKWAFKLVEEQKVAPSMRSLQFGGQAIESHNAKLYNCSVTHVHSIRSFAESFYLLLNGCGVGFGITNRYLSRLPNLVDEDDKNGTVINYVVQDTIEGWSDSLEALLNCYFKNTAYTGRKIVFDYSRIRKKGSPLKTSGGKAPGYKGLKAAHIKIKNLLDHAIEFNKQIALSTVNAYDILMHTADAVLSGGVRRSACSVMFDKHDEGMLNAKTLHKVDRVFAFSELKEIEQAGIKKKIYEGRVLYQGIKYDVELEDWELERLKKDNNINWWHINPQRARSNNSVILLRNEVSREEFIEIVKRTRQFGEPGFVWANDPRSLFNPCYEVSFIPVTDEEIPGVQMCNLTTQNGSKIKTLQDFRETTEASAIIGTLQAGYTDFKYLSNTAKKLTEAEALLGCSITGIMDNPEVLLNPENQRECSKIAKDTNELWAKKIGINPAARITLVKPEGTSSLVLGTGSGIHAHHAREYFRRIQCNKIDPVYRFFKKHNPHMCEESVWSANKTDDVITFPIRIADTCMVKKDLSAIKHLEIIKSTQENWVLPGTTKYNTKDVVHNVSCTVVVAEDEWESVINYIYDNRQTFTAVSLLSKSGDKDYPQAPMEEVITDEDKERFSFLYDNLKSIDYTLLEEEEDRTMMTAEGTCVGGACETNVSV